MSVEIMESLNRLPVHILPYSLHSVREKLIEGRLPCKQHETIFLKRCPKQEIDVKGVNDYVQCIYHDVREGKKMHFMLD